MLDVNECFGFFQQLIRPLSIAALDLDQGHQLQAGASLGCSDHDLLALDPPAPQADICRRWWLYRIHSIVYPDSSLSCFSSSRRT